MIDLAPAASRALIRPLAWYLRHSPVEKGRWRLEIAATRLSQSLRGSLASRRVRTQYGFLMDVDGESQAGRMIYATGRYEHGAVQVVRRLLKSGDTVIDGGAHIGFFSVLCAGIVAPHGRVHAFEPSGSTRRVLERNLRLNGCPNVSVHPEALGARAGQSVLSYVAASESGQATTREVDAVAREDVEIVALDTYADMLRGVRFVKLDLEGGEYDALVGMRRILRDHHPHVLVEVTDAFLRSTGSSASALYRFMIAEGYRAFVIEDDQGLVAVESEQAWRQMPGQFNALFSTQSTIS